MRLDQWVAAADPGELSRLARETQLAYTTVFAIAHGQQTPKYATAKRISEATGGEVTIAELCEPRSGRRRRRRRAA